MYICKFIDQRKVITNQAGNRCTNIAKLVTNRMQLYELQDMSILVDVQHANGHNDNKSNCIKICFFQPDG